MLSINFLLIRDTMFGRTMKDLDLISDHWTERQTVRLIQLDQLKNHWNLYKGGLQGHVIDGMAEAVENCEFMIVCVSQAYFDSKNCKKEIEYADDLGKTLIVVKLDPNLNLAGHGSFSMILSKQLYVNPPWIMDHDP